MTYSNRFTEDECRRLLLLLDNCRPMRLNDIMDVLGISDGKDFKDLTMLFLLQDLEVLGMVHPTHIGHITAKYSGTNWRQVVRKYIDHHKIVWDFAGQSVDVQVAKTEELANICAMQIAASLNVQHIANQRGTEIDYFRRLQYAYLLECLVEELRALQTHHTNLINGNYITESFKEIE